MEALGDAGRAFMWATVLTVGATSVGGFLGDGFNQPEAGGKYAPETPASFDPRGDLEEAQRNLHRVRVSLGESCFTLLNTYVDGPLSYVGLNVYGDQEKIPAKESVVVQDALANPKQPCGDNPTDVRIKYRQLEEVSHANTAAESVDIKQALKEIEGYKKYTIANKKDNDFDGLPEGFGLGLKIGPLIGLLSGIVSYVRRKRNPNLIGRRLGDDYDGY